MNASKRDAYRNTSYERLQEHKKKETRMKSRTWGISRQEGDSSSEQLGQGGPTSVGFHELRCAQRLAMWKGVLGKDDCQ